MGQAIIAGSFAEGDSRKTKEVAIRVLQVFLQFAVPNFFCWKPVLPKKMPFDSNANTSDTTTHFVQMGLILGVVMAIVLALVTGSMAGLFTDDAGVLKIVPYLIPVRLLTYAS